MKHFETQIRDFSQQFTDQVKCLDAKVAVDTGILGNILDLYKRRAVIEQEYADNLLKLSSSISQRNSAENQKRLKWKNYSPINVLNTLLASTQGTAKAHKNLADIYGKQITQRLIDMQEDCVRLNRKTVDILQKHHTEIIKSLNQLLIKQKFYAKSFNETDEARKRADKAMEQLDREVIRCQDKKKELDKNPKIKKMKEEYIERYSQYKSKQNESTNARNKYIIHLVSLKETIDYFYSNELKAIVQCAEYGFHNNLTRLSMNHISCEEALTATHDSINTLFTDTVEKIDANNDTKVFFDVYKSMMTLKENLHFNPVKDDNINKIVKSQESIQNSLQNMYVRFNTEMSSVTKKLEEDKKCIDSLSKTLNDLINQNDYDVLDYICQQSQPDNNSIRERTTSLPRNGVSDSLYTTLQKTTKENKLKTENSYFMAMEMYLNNEINKINMATKLKSVENALSTENDDMENQNQKSNQPNINSVTAVLIGMKSKLFGGDINKYSRDTNEIIPMIVKSCIRLINLYGMRNMGVFRVPGCQTDVLGCKSQFELGNDPLKSLKGTPNDVNLAASILKLYFRELDPPIFDDVMFNKIVENYNLVKRNEESVVTFLKGLVITFHPPAYATLKYLLSFVSHLAEFSAENCMDILNLAIIFGPCLMPIPDDKSNQLFQFQNIVNHVAQCLITHHQTIFEKESLGPAYCRDQQSTDTESGHFDSNITDTTKTKFFDQDLTSSTEDVHKSKPELKNLKRNESTRYVRSSGADKPLRMRRNSDSERVFDLLSVAITDYHAKSDGELSFSNGDILLLKKKINEHWWSGYVVRSPEQGFSNNVGLIPSTFIRVYSQNETLSGAELENHETNKSQEKDLSSPESQRLSRKSRDEHKSMASISSDNELDLSPDDNRSLSHSLENAAGLSEFGESKSFGSFENITADEDDNLLIKSDDTSSVEKTFHLNKPTEDVETQPAETIIKIRGSSSSIGGATEVADSTADTIDEDLQKTLQGLKRYGELNVMRHRNTVHIDRSMLASKFLSPLASDSNPSFSKTHKIIESIPQNKPVVVSEFKIKKPENVSNFTSSFEMNQSPAQSFRLSDHQNNNLGQFRTGNQDDNQNGTGLPPPTLPKPKHLKK